MAKLYDALIEYGKSDYVPFHMPGHKRALMEFENPYSFDITEIDGFDNLHHAEGVIRDAQEYAAQIYETQRCFFSVNGSTAALLAAISACVADIIDLITVIIVFIVVLATLIVVFVATFAI